MSKKVMGGIAAGVIVVILVGVLVIQTMNNKKSNLSFDKEGVFITYTWTPAGATTQDDFYARTTEIYGSGYVVIKHDEQVIDSFHVKEKDISELQKLIEDVNFMGLKEEIDSDAQDGIKAHITVITKDATHTSGGFNPNDDRFEQLEKRINKLTKISQL